MAMNINDLDLVIDLVRRRSGIALDRTKEYLVEARLAMLARQQHIPSIDEIVARLRRLGAADLEKAVVTAMTTNETSFLRDQHPFEALKNHVIPDLIARRMASRRISMWCAASSTGQEPYTVAILLREHFPALAGWEINFLASDLSEEVLARARAGTFSQLEVNRGLPARWLVKYFKKQGTEWELIPEIRSMVQFKQVNLLETWPAMPPLDVVFIRNVLIYFEHETKKKILGRIRKLMMPDGYLFLGNAETTLNIDDSFQRSTFERSGCYRLATALTAAA
jgi:chemotaxis protein methyltransferase CheR